MNWISSDQENKDVVSSVKLEQSGMCCCCCWCCCLSFVGGSGAVLHVGRGADGETGKVRRGRQVRHLPADRVRAGAGRRPRPPRSPRPPQQPSRPPQVLLFVFFVVKLFAVGELLYIPPASKKVYIHKFSLQKPIGFVAATATTAATAATAGRAPPRPTPAPCRRTATATTAPAVPRRPSRSTSRRAASPT